MVDRTRGQLNFGRLRQTLGWEVIELMRFEPVGEIAFIRMTVDQRRNEAYGMPMMR